MIEFILGSILFIFLLSAIFIEAFEIVRPIFGAIFLVGVIGMFVAVGCVGLLLSPFLIAGFLIAAIFLGGSFVGAIATKEKEKKDESKGSKF